MGASLIDIKKRIDSTQMTKQITSAMQMVSAAKLARSEQHVREFKKYAEKIQEIVTHLANELAHLDDYEDKDVAMALDSFIDYHDMLIERPVAKTCYLVVSSDQGLAGNYNSAIFHSTLEMIHDHHEHANEYTVMAIGSEAVNFFKKENIDVVYQLDAISDFPSYDEVRELITRIVSMFKKGEFDAFYVCYNHHVNAMMSIFRVEQMLPIIHLDAMHYDEDKHAEYIFEPSKEAVLANLLPQYAESLIYGAIIDAKTAEHASRMIAMRSATDNANTLIQQLKKEYNQKRQSAITQEITEIVGGSAALE